MSKWMHHLRGEALTFSIGFSFAGIMRFGAMAQACLAAFCMESCYWSIKETGQSKPRVQNHCVFNNNCKENCKSGFRLHNHQFSIRTIKYKGNLQIWAQASKSVIFNNDYKGQLQIWAQAPKPTSSSVCVCVVLDSCACLWVCEFVGLWVCVCVCACTWSAWSVSGTLVRLQCPSGCIILEELQSQPCPIRIIKGL